MPTNNPVSNLAFNTWLSPNQSNSSFEGLLLAQYLKGGYQTVTTLDDRDAIPIYNEGAVAVHSGFTNSGDGGKTTGRRSLGMMVHVIDPAGDGSVLPKTYVLVPFGYFGNNGILGWDSWTQLPEWEKAKRMKPSATVYSQAFPSSIEFTLPEAQVEDDCWVELIQFTEHPLPSGGSAGQVLAKIDEDDQNVGWVSPQAGAQGPTGPQGLQGLSGNVSNTWIGNMYTHPTDNGLPSGLMYDGNVQVTTGDLFSVNVYGSDGSYQGLNGVFIAVNDFTMDQSTTTGAAVTELLTHLDINMELFAAAIPPIVETTKTFSVTVVNTTGSNKFAIDGVEQDILTLIRGNVYLFDFSGYTYATHPFLLSETSDGSHNSGTSYTTGLTYTGASDQSFTLSVSNVTPDTLYYFCGLHPNMGGLIRVLDPGGGNYQDSDVAAFLNGNLNGHIIPDTNATYDIGSAEYKIRHLYLSDNSVYFGDNNVQLNSEKVLNTLNFSADPTVPTNSTDSVPGQKGDIRFDLTHMYICVEDNVWKRITLDDTFNI